MSDFLFVKLSEKEFDEILSKLKMLVYEYNTKLKDFKIWLKPYHSVKHDKNRVYYYIGRYWFKIYYKDGRVHWIYLGNKKPLPYLPDPPAIPKVTIIKIDNYFYVLQQDLEKLKRFLESGQGEKAFSQ